MKEKSKFIDAKIVDDKANNNNAKKITFNSIKFIQFL